MLLLEFQLNEIRYAIDTRDVREVLGRVSIVPSTGSKGAVLGTTWYRGAHVPVIDLALVFAARPAEILISTRTVIVDVEIDGEPRRFAFLAERTSGTLRASSSELDQLVPLATQGLPMRQVSLDDRTLLRLVDTAAVIASCGFRYGVGAR